MTQISKGLLYVIIYVTSSVRIRPLLFLFPQGALGLFISKCCHNNFSAISAAVRPGHRKHSLEGRICVNIKGSYAHWKESTHSPSCVWELLFSVFYRMSAGNELFKLSWSFSSSFNAKLSLSMLVLMPGFLPQAFIISVKQTFVCKDQHSLVWKGTYCSYNKSFQALI